VLSLVNGRTFGEIPLGRIGFPSWLSLSSSLEMSFETSVIIS